MWTKSTYKYCQLSIFRQLVLYLIFDKPLLSYPSHVEEFLQAYHSSLLLVSTWRRQHAASSNSSNNVRKWPTNVRWSECGIVGDAVVASPLNVSSRNVIFKMNKAQWGSGCKSPQFVFLKTSNWTSKREVWGNVCLCFWGSIFSIVWKTSLFGLDVHLSIPPTVFRHWHCFSVSFGSCRSQNSSLVSTFSMRRSAWGHCSLIKPSTSLIQPFPSSFLVNPYGLKYWLLERTQNAWSCSAGGGGGFFGKPVICPFFHGRNSTCTCEWPNRKATYETENEDLATNLLEKITVANSLLTLGFS